MSDPLDSVNEHSRILRRWAADPANAKQSNRWRSTADALDALATEVLDLRKKAGPLPTKLGDLSDIPAELRSELTGIELDELEGQLVTAINAYGGTADLNQILVGLFRKFKVVQKRRLVQQRLWRMQNDGLVWAVPRKKGVYTTSKPNPIDQAVADALDDHFGPSKEPALVAGAKDDDDEIPF